MYLGSICYDIRKPEKLCINVNNDNESGISNLFTGDMIPR